MWAANKNESNQNENITVNFNPAKSDVDSNEEISDSYNEDQEAQKQEDQIRTPREKRIRKLPSHLKDFEVMLVEEALEIENDSTYKEAAENKN